MTRGLCALGICAALWLAQMPGHTMAQTAQVEDCIKQCTAAQLQQRLTPGKVHGAGASTRGAWLAAAISQRRPEAVQALLAAGVDPNAQRRWEVGADSVTMTPLMHAITARAGLAVVKALVAGGARAQQASEGQWPLNTALSLGQLDVADHLLSQGARADSTDSILQATTLMELALGARAAESSAVAPMARQLAERGADVNAQGKRGVTALLLAVLSGHQALVQQLLDLKADPNVSNDRGETVLAVARRKQQDALVQLLLAYGARG